MAASPRDNSCALNRDFVPFFLRAARLLVIAYLALVLFGIFGAEHLIFVPHPSSYRDDAGILKLRTADGQTISAIYLQNPRAAFTILYCHGNGEDLGDDLPLLGEYKMHGFSVFTFDYHGYGTSTGRPSERHAYEDIDAAYRYLTQQLGVPAARILVHGHSLGSGVAIDLASRQPVGGLIAESAFVTAFRVQTHWPIVPFDRFRNIDKISKVRSPVLVIHGTKDGLIRPWHGRSLFARASQPKFLLWVEGAGHNDVPEVGGGKYWSAIRNFAQFVERHAR